MKTFFKELAATAFGSVIVVALFITLIVGGLIVKGVDSVKEIKHVNSSK